MDVDDGRPDGTKLVDTCTHAFRSISKASSDPVPVTFDGVTGVA
jgi:hypothetical protein